METPFTLEDIDRAHEGATQETVGKYLTDLRDLGVVSYVTYVSDGHSEYFDGKGAGLVSAVVHEAYEVSDTADRDAALRALEAHGAGKTDYFAFSRQLAAAGVCTWVMDPIRMTCTYYSKSGEKLHADDI